MHCIALHCTVMHFIILLRSALSRVQITKDCKTFRIFAYSSEREQSNKKVWNEAENREREWGERLKFIVVWTTMKCRHLLKIDTAYKLYATDTTEMLKTDVKLCDKDGDGENRERKKNRIPAEELNSLHL